MERSKLWLALSALSVVSHQAMAQDDPDRAGAVTTLQPQVQAKIGDESPRVLVIGSDVYRNELIRTDTEGVAHLMFTDRSSLTVGPNSEVILDKFVYDPEAGTGELALSATKGVLRFVGGALSKEEDAVQINTPLGRLGIRGGGLYTWLRPTSVLACMFYGEELSGTSSISNTTKRVDKLEQCIELKDDGTIDEPALTREMIDEIFEDLTGEESDNLPLDPTFNFSKQVTKDIWNDLADKEDISDVTEDEQFENAS